MKFEVDHHYGSQVHILDDLFLSTMLAQLCQPQTTQPLITELVTHLYTSLMKTVLHREFPSEEIEVQLG